MNKILLGILLAALMACNTNETKKTPTIQGADTAKKTAITTIDTPLKTNKPVALPVTFGTDTLLVTKKCIVCHEPTDAEVKKLQKEGGENFGEALSDNLFYLDETKTYAKNLKIEAINTQANCIVFITQDGKRFIKTRGKDYTNWGVIAFTTNAAPINISMVASNDALKKTFK